MCNIKNLYKYKEWLFKMSLNKDNIAQNLTKWPKHLNAS